MNDANTFSYYGVAYLDVDGSVQFKTSDDYLELCHFKADGVWEGYYATPVVQMNALEIDAEQEPSVAMIAKLQNLYNGAYFEALQQLSSKEPVNSLDEVLEEYKNEIDNSDQLQVRLFKEVIRISLESKVLWKDAARKFLQWLEDTRTDVPNLSCGDADNTITIYGFIYENDDTEISCFASIDEASVYRKKAEHDKSALFSTEVISYMDCLQQHQTVVDVTERFIDNVLKLFLGRMLSYMRLVKNSFSNIQESEYNKLCAYVKEFCNIEAYETFLTYGFLWNVKQYF